MSLVSRSLIRHSYFRTLDRFRGLAAPQSSEPDESKASQRQAKELTHGEQRSYLEEVFVKREQEPKTTAQKVKKKAENTFYYSVAAISVAAFGALAYYLLDQIFASDSPQRIYSKSLKMIQADERCLAVLGEKIAGHGEDTGRGRRRHIAHHR
ncbi:Protein F56B3.11 a [Aphelenchoides avenae]|nr:Protein F56B3.11 a [Aphelenchus avenae]